MNIIELYQQRYATKVFDESFELSSEQYQLIEQMLCLAPSSTNIQPWHFIMATSEEGKARIAKSMAGTYDFNAAKALAASCLVVFCSQIDVNEQHLAEVLLAEEIAGRYATLTLKDTVHHGRLNYANKHQYDLKDYAHWAEKQVYLNLGSFLIGVASLNLDALAMEGFNRNILDEEFNLRAKGYSSSVVVAIGKHHSTDFNYDLPKSRLSSAILIEHV